MYGPLRASIKILIDSGRYQRPLAWVLLLWVLLSRCHEFLLAPSLRVEDGAKVFAFFYSERDWSTLFRFKGGYLPFGPNLMGFLSVRLPVQLAPYALTAVPFIQALVAFALFSCRDFRLCVRSDATRCVLCLSLALSPVGQFHLLCHTDFSIWSALLIVFWQALLPSGQNLWRAGGGLLIGQLFLWSNPLSFVAAPLNLVHLLRSRQLRARLVQGLWLLAHAAHVAFGLEPGQAGRLASELAHFAFWTELAQRTFWHIASRSCFRAFFGASLNGWAEENARPLIYGFAALFAVMVVFVIVRGPRHGTRFVYLACSYLAIALTAAIVATKSDAAIAGGHQRYHYVQALLVLALGVLVAAHAAAPLKRWLGKALWPAFGCAVAGLGLLSTIGNMRPYREPYPENPERIRDCTRRLAELEREHGDRACGFSLQCRKVRDWTISIRTPPCP